MQGGLAAFAWSPDGELVVLVTQQRQLLLMSKVRIVLSTCGVTQSFSQLMQGTGEQY